MTDEPTAAPPRWIEYMPLETILPALRNPKNHDEETIAAGISRFGIIDLVSLDERTGRLVSGHGRINDAVARREAGETPPDGVEVDPEGVWLMPVTRGWRSRSDEDAHAAGVVLNQATIAGGFSGDLAQLLAELQGTPEGLLGTGFSDDDLAIMLDQAKDDEPPDFEPGDPDDQPRLDKKAPITCPHCGVEFIPE